MKSLYKEKNKKLSVKELDIPLINSKNDLRIKVDMAGICRTDQYVANDFIEYNDNIIIGHEFTGIIEASLNKNFKEGDRVVYNPIFNDLTMLGVDRDGCFSEFISVPSFNALQTSIKDKKLAAYIEPIAASLAPLKSKFINKNINGAIFGKNRISELTLLILKKEGYNNFIIIDKEDEYSDEYFDLIIETSLNKESIEYISKKIKKNGILILKSRYPKDILINFYNIVKKEIIIEALYYNSFEYAENFAFSNQDLFIDLFGTSFHFDNWEEAFHHDNIGKHKIFFKGFE